MSDNPGVANASVSQPGVVQIVANSPGSASITVTVEDGRGGLASTAFVITVVQPNGDPTIGRFRQLELLLASCATVSFEASDPDGDPLTALAMSDNPGVADAGVPQPGVVQIFANSPGSANITVTVEDGRGGSASTTYTADRRPAQQRPHHQSGRSAG